MNNIKTKETKIGVCVSRVGNEMQEKSTLIVLCNFMTQMDF